MQEVSRNTDREPGKACFQCPVPADQSAGTIRSGRRQINVTVAETSIDGFTVLVDAKLIGRMSFGRPWILTHLDTIFEVGPEWLYNAPDGFAQIGLRRIRELSKPQRPKVKPGSSKRLISVDGSTTSLAFAGIVLFIFLSLALPGFGDNLGTAPRINAAVSTFAQLLSSLLG